MRINRAANRRRGFVTAAVCTGALAVTCLGFALYPSEGLFGSAPGNLSDSQITTLITGKIMQREDSLGIAQYFYDDGSYEYRWDIFVISGRYRIRHGLVCIYKVANPSCFKMLKRPLGPTLVSEKGIVSPVGFSNIKFNRRRP